MSIETPFIPATKGFRINKEHLKIDIKGFVQGLGFRPFIVRLARQHQQKGWIANTTDGVTIAIEGAPEQQQNFLSDLNNQLPPFAEIKSLSITRQALWLIFVIFRLKPVLLMANNRSLYYLT